MALHLVTCSIALLCAGLAPQEPVRGAEAELSVHERAARSVQPDLDAAVAVAYRAFEAAVLSRPAGEWTRLFLCPDVADAGGDATRTHSAAERFAHELHERGSGAELLASRPASSAIGSPCILVGVERAETSYSLTLRDETGTELLGARGIAVEFVEKPWVRGDLPAMPRFAHVFRAEGFATCAADARRAADAELIARLRELLPACAASSVGVLRERSERCVLDRFESGSTASEAARCAVLVGVTAEDLERFEADAARVRRAAALSCTAKGGAGCLWLALCVMLCARADLSTRGYLTWTWRSLFTLVFAAGVAAIASWF